MAMRRVLRALPAAVLGGALALFTAGVVAAAAPSINVQQQGTHLLVSGEVALAASAKTAWSVLTDYERVPEFVPGIRMSRVVATEAGGKVLEQQGEMLANNMRMFYQGTLRVVEQPPERIDVQFLSGTFANMQGQWVITGKRAPVKLAYRIDYDAMTPYPSPIMINMIQQQVALWVTSVAAEIERREPPAPVRHKKRRKGP
jgi:ribosome-associated toxin RatA of RatAB toxin-antitoxin module